MTKEEARKNADIMAAYIQGKKIEVLLDDGDWVEIDEPSFDFLHETYRVKESTYREFHNPKECLNEMCKHKPHGQVYFETTDEYAQLAGFTEDGIKVTVNYDYPFYQAYKNLKFADGKPFGIKE